MAKPQYPSEILPQQGWRQCINTQELSERCPDAMLGRKMDGTRDHCINPDDEAIYMSVLPISSIPNLSCSLLGTFFKVGYLHFLPDNNGKVPWTTGQSVCDDMLREENYNYYPDVTVVGWKVKDVFRLPLPYTRSFDKKKLYDDFKESAKEVAELRKQMVFLNAWEDLKKNPDNANLRIVEVEGEARVNHAPTMLNYWHFTIDVYPAETDLKPLTKASEGWRKNLAANLCDFLRRNYVIIEDDTQVAQVDDDTLWVNK